MYLNGTFNSSVLGSSLACKTLADWVAAADAGALYANIHTVTNPGGLVRGQVELDGEEGGVSRYSVSMSGLNQVSNNTIVPIDTPTTAMLRLRVDPANDLATWELNVTYVTDMISSHVHGGNTTSNGPAAVLLAPAEPPPEAPAAPPPGETPSLPPPDPGAAPQGASVRVGCVGALPGARVACLSALESQPPGRACQSFTAPAPCSPAGAPLCAGGGRRRGLGPNTALLAGRPRQQMIS